MTSWQDDGWAMQVVLSQHGSARKATKRPEKDADCIGYTKSCGALHTAQLPAGDATFFPFYLPVAYQLTRHNMVTNAAVSAYACVAWHARTGCLSRHKNCH
jgi:hypothetical protein